MELIDTGAWPFWLIIAAFAATGGVIAVAGTVMTRTADRLSDLSGMGEAIFGAVFMGGSTSLPGIVTSITAASGGYAQLAYSNGVGGIAVQTAWLAIADMTYRRVNLEHAAASLQNMVQGALLMSLLALPLLAMAGPEWDLFGLHPVSLLIALGYGFGLRLVRRAQSEPLWLARETEDTRMDKPGEQKGGRQWPLWLSFAGLALVTALAGYLIAVTGVAIAERTGLGETAVGGFLTAATTSIPELVMCLAAVRQGALTLAVGGIIGGNCFDTLLVVLSDLGYREGSIYHAVGEQQVFMTALAIVITGILLLGLLRREKHGFGNIGFESMLVLVVYLCGSAVLFTQY